MDFGPRQTFGRILERHQSNAAIEELAFMLELRREEWQLHYQTVGTGPASDRMVSRRTNQRYFVRCRFAQKLQSSRLRHDLSYAASSPLAIAQYLCDILFHSHTSIHEHSNSHHRYSPRPQHPRSHLLASKTTYLNFFCLRFFNFWRASWLICLKTQWVCAVSSS